MAFLAFLADLAKSGWALAKPLTRSWAAWGVAAVLGLALALWIVAAERDRARATIKERDDSLAAIAAQLEAAEQGRRAALNDQAQAEAALASYAVQSAIAFQGQVETSRRLAEQVLELNRRVRAAEQEIARADPNLRLDDPLPRGVRDGLACAGGDAKACAAPAADPGRVSGVAAEPGRLAHAHGRGADGA